MRHSADALSSAEAYAAPAWLRKPLGWGLREHPAPLAKGAKGLEQTPRFVVFRDFGGRYRWSLRSGLGTTIATSASGHATRSECAREMGRWQLAYPEAPVRDATERGSEQLPLHRWLASRSDSGVQ
jgi:uncharacterized protein YegP (UPF0339 family)